MELATCMLVGHFILGAATRYAASRKRSEACCFPPASIGRMISREAAC
jgi:hypothetical protein